MQTRSIVKILKSQKTSEGAGVKLKRVFGFHEVPLFDPFLMLDHFQSANPADYLAGFPWHPHRGIETVSYLLDGRIEHSDSMGNQGVIGPGDVQWMTAGSGIVHQEMPQENPDGRIWGFQLWTNLPAAQKMMPPRYRDVKAASIPEVQLKNGVSVKVISGTVEGVPGPVGDIVTDPEFFDVIVPMGTSFVHTVKPGHRAFAYVIAGKGNFGEEPNRGSTIDYGPETVILYDLAGDHVQVRAVDQPVRFLFLSGKPLDEPVAWYGPIVMNTDEELQTALVEYRNGTFIKQNEIDKGLPVVGQYNGG